MQGIASTRRGPGLRPSAARRVRSRILAPALLVLTSCGRPGAEYELRLGHDQPERHPYHQAMERFAQGVSDATEGAVQVRIFPAAQLGDSPEQIEGLRLGTLDLALAAFSHASQFCPELGLFGAPFLFEDADHFAAVFDGPVGERLDAACEERYDIHLLSTLTSGYRILFNGRRPVDDVDDLEGLKVRVMGGEADALTWEAFGAIPSPMPYSEVYQALQAGVIDGAENEPISILSNRFYEAAPHFARTDHLVLPMGLFAGGGAWSGLPEEYREILRREAREAAVWERDFVAERNEAALREMRESFGVRVSDLDPEELRPAGAEIQDRVAADLGLEDLLAEVRAARR